MKPLLPLALILLASCSPPAPPELRLADAWARATVPGQTATAAYVTIANTGGRADTLVSVTSPVPSRASLHRSTNENGIARMRPVEGGLEIGAGDTLTLEPRGAHIMIENLAEPLRGGETYPLTLRFQRSGERRVEFDLRAGAAGHGGHQE